LDAFSSQIPSQAHIKKEQLSDPKLQPFYPIASSLQQAVQTGLTFGVPMAEALPVVYSAATTG